jgi:hypothetical protein
MAERSHQIRLELKSTMQSIVDDGCMTIGIDESGTHGQQLK